jgi:hypothetical protein
MPTRRDWLLGATAVLLVRDALAQGRVEKGVRRRSGEVRISGETISTGADGRVVFVVGADAMMVRPNSSLTLVTNGFRLVTGAVLSVFASGAGKQLRTPTATIGIRGTAVYIEAEPGRTYVCTCYGEAVLEPLADPAARETVRTRHHEQPRYIMPRARRR